MHQEARETAATVVRPVFEPPRLGEGLEAGTLVLRDGSRVTLNRALPEDAPSLRTFLTRLAEAERREVTESLRLEVEKLEGFLEGLTAGKSGEAFFVHGGSSTPRVVAFGAYRLLTGEEAAAAVTLAVAPELRQMGIATLLLERLVVLAARRDVERLIGVAHESNDSLIALFRRGGFAASEHRAGGYVTFVLSTRSSALAQLEGMGARAFAAASLRPLFFPRSVAVVGASRDPRSVGGRILTALVQGGFRGPVYPVNPQADYVGSIHAYPSVTAIGVPVDLAVIAVPAAAVAAVVEGCIESGVKGLVVITAGFAETGEEGKERQRALLAQVREHGLRMVGPNCLGMMHTDPEVQLNASFAPAMPPFGSVALCSQSGALGIAIIALARRLGLGLSSFVSVGNKADVSGNDLLEYWEEDPHTSVVLFYLESFGNPRRFARIARRVGRAKPIVVVKAGRSEAGSRAASSHTAALVVADTAVDALFRQTGILRADTLEEMFGVARVLTEQPLPRGRRVAILTNAGGPAILCTDALAAAGLAVEPLSDATRASLQAFLPAAASTRNPVDMIAAAGPEEFRRAAAILLQAEEVDALVVIYTPTGMVQVRDVGRAVAAGITEGRNGSGRDKPVLASIVGDDVDTYVLEAADERIPVFLFPEEMGKVLGRIYTYAAWRAADPGVFPEFADQDLAEARKICQEALAERGSGWLAVEKVRRVIAAAGLTLAPGGVAADVDVAVVLAAEVGYPVAMTIAAFAIVHKSDKGFVKLNLDGPEAVRAAGEDMLRRLEEEGELESFQGLLVQPMIRDATEVMIGVNQDPVFGPLIAFGLGGIHVEILRDVLFRVSPLTDRDAREMIRGIRGYRLFEGYRGHAAADVAALEEALLRISRLVEAVPEIAELDLNPLFALRPGEGYRVVDARVKLVGV